MKKSVRYLAVSVLDDIDNGNFISDAIDKQIIAEELPKNDAAFLTLLVKSVYENIMAIDYFLARHSSRGLKEIDKEVLSVLRIGATELLVITKQADYAAINEAVEAVKALGHKGASGFVNAVLRNILRANSSIAKLKETTPEDISIKYSIPLWIIRLLEKEYGLSTMKKIVANRQDTSYISFRILDNDEELKIKLLEKYPESKTSNMASNCIMLKNTGSPYNIEEFRNGLITVADPASILVGNIAKKISVAMDNPLILDLCAAPGGKATHLSEIKNSKVLACDLTNKKLERIKDNIKRLNIKNIKLYKNDATIFNSQLEGKFDLVLCDLPCSGLGLMNKKSDIRYRLKKEDITALADVQQSILKNAITYLKPNGFLIFSTCTLTSEENQKGFLYLKQRLKPISLRGGEYIQLLQGIDKSDGFFISLFTKRST